MNERIRGKDGLELTLEMVRGIYETEDVIWVGGLQKAVFAFNFMVIWKKANGGMVSRNPT